MAVTVVTTATVIHTTLRSSLLRVRKRTVILNGLSLLIFGLCKRTRIQILHLELIHGVAGSVLQEDDEAGRGLFLLGPETHHVLTGFTSLGTFKSILTQFFLVVRLVELLANRLILVLGSERALRLRGSHNLSASWRFVTGIGGCSGPDNHVNWSVVAHWNRSLRWVFRLVPLLAA